MSTMVSAAGGQRQDPRGCRRGCAIFALVILLLGAATFILGRGSPAEERLRRLAGLPASTRLTPEAARAALLKRLPPGTRLEAVYAYLESKKVGRDGLSHYYPFEEGEIVCRIECDPHSWNLVQESYGLFFRFDRMEQLRDVRVERWLTGL